MGSPGRNHEDERSRSLGKLIFRSSFLSKFNLDSEFGIRHFLIFFSVTIRNLFIKEEIYGRHKPAEITYQKAARLMRLILAEKKRLLLFSYASFDNRPPYQIQAVLGNPSSRPRLCLAKIPILLPCCLPERYLNFKDRIKSLPFFTTHRGPA